MHANANVMAHVLLRRPPLLRVIMASRFITSSSFHMRLSSFPSSTLSKTRFAQLRFLHLPFWKSFEISIVMPEGVVCLSLFFVSGFSQDEFSSEKVFGSLLFGSKCVHSKGVYVFYLGDRSFSQKWKFHSL